MTYSGYLLEDLRRAGKADWNALMDATDLLIDGPFVQELAGNHLWRGSDNQRLHYLSGRIQPPEEEQVPRAQVRILSDGRVQLSGFPLKKFEKALEKALDVRS